MKYEELVLNIKDYYTFRIRKGGLKYLLSITSSGYPRVLSLGVCMHDTKQIVICKVFNWKLRLLHEQGHERGLKHTFKINHVMYPYGIFRGPLY